MRGDAFAAITDRTSASAETARDDLTDSHAKSCHDPFAYSKDFSKTTSNVHQSRDMPLLFCLGFPVFVDTSLRE
jgi:hypothetical protein